MVKFEFCLLIFHIIAIEQIYSAPNWIFRVNKNDQNGIADISKDSSLEDEGTDPATNDEYDDVAHKAHISYGNINYEDESRQSGDDFIVGDLLYYEYGDEAELDLKQMIVDFFGSIDHQENVGIDRTGNIPNFNEYEKYDIKISDNNDDDDDDIGYDNISDEIYDNHNDDIDDETDDDDANNNEEEKPLWKRFSNAFKNKVEIRKVLTTASSPIAESSKRENRIEPNQIYQTTKYTFGKELLAGSATLANVGYQSSTQIDGVIEICYPEADRLNSLDKISPIIKVKILVVNESDNSSAQLISGKLDTPDDTMQEQVCARILVNQTTSFTIVAGFYS